MNKKDFGVSFLGWGFYGLPLTTYVKKEEKQAIHIGKSLNLLLGIKEKDNPRIKINKGGIISLKEYEFSQSKKIEGEIY
jgi:hypothetical protein